MDIKVIGRKITVTEPLMDYTVEKISNSLKVFDLDFTTVEVTLKHEKTKSSPCICEVTIRAKGHTIHVEERDDDMYAAIDMAAAKTLRQLRKYKTRVIDHHLRETPVPIQPTNVSLDELMAELAGDPDDEVVRVKEMEFEVKTLDQALIQIDLLGHDFYVFTDRDTNEVNVLYRRKDGGYGLLKPPAE